MRSPALHVSGQVHVGPQDIRPDLWVVQGRVTFVKPALADVLTVRGHALPGLVDAHSHVGLEATGAVGPERAEQHALADREAGALLLRDAGSAADTRWIQQRADLPRLVRAGRHIARTRQYIRGFAHEIEPDQLVDYVRAEARGSDGWVKLVGDWISRDAADLAPCWPREALVAAVAAAHQEGARVTAHCFGEESLRDFAAAGADCVEHACGLRPDTIDAFAAAGVAIVPTLVNIANFPKHADAGEAKFPRYAAHMRDLHARRHETVGAAHEAGVPIYTGTDAGGSLPHGLIAQEVLELTRAGLSAADAIGAATWRAREWLGFDGLSEGAEADLAVYSQDPLEDVRALATPAHLILRGRLLR
jgi:imidazolonepropionase-like amidohydrolase